MVCIAAFIFFTLKGLKIAGNAALDSFLSRNVAIGALWDVLNFNSQLF